MNWPEEEWNISPKNWGKMSWEDRAKLEVEQQATKYNSLKDNFVFHKKISKNKLK